MFEIKELNNGEFQIILRAGNGQVLLQSEGYSTKSAAKVSVISIKKNAQRENAIQKMTSSKGKPYFILKAINGQVIGTSQMYESEAARDNGIESVKRYAI